LAAGGPGELGSEVVLKWFGGGAKAAWAVAVACLPVLGEFEQGQQRANQLPIETGN
jgi:hypothetical protein